MKYYDQKGVKRAIIDFVYSGSSVPFREGAFYSEKIDGIQRHSPDENGDSVLVIDSEKVIARAVKEGATAFYSSYWRYSDPADSSGVRGRDLAWSLKAEDGGLSAAKKLTILFLEALEKEGFPSPLVKYSGELGFDVLIPLERIQTSSPQDLDFLSKVQEDLTRAASDYIRAGNSFDLKSGDNSQIVFSGRLGTCHLTELRWRRGLLLAPMSLHPSSGLVSVPILPREVPEFSVIEASPEKVRPREWSIARAVSGSRTEPVYQTSSRGAILQNGKHGEMRIPQGTSAQEVES